MCSESFCSKKDESNTLKGNLVVNLSSGGFFSPGNSLQDQTTGLKKEAKNFHKTGLT